MTSNCTVLIAGARKALLNDVRALRPDWLIHDRMDDARLFGQARLDRSGIHKTSDRADAVFGFIHWLLPDMSGIEACRRLRTLATPGRLHLTMVLDSGAPDARSRAIDAGADDYMHAPLTASAIVARIAQASPSSPDAAPSWPFDRTPSTQDRASADHNPGGRLVGGLLHHGDLLVDPNAFHVRHKSQVVPLSRGEIAMLVYFMQRPNRIISREALAEQTGKVGMIQARTIDRSVARLRKTLESHAIPAPIRTVYGMGYVFDALD